MWKFLRKYIFFVIVFLVAFFSFKIMGAVNRNEEVTRILDRVNELKTGYYYEEALKIINSIDYENEKISAAKKEIESLKSNITDYDGQVYHVFFHSLIVYPELAFDGDIMHEGYDMWMTTVSEFKAMLPQLYERGFILYPLNEIKGDKKIRIPKGKKPLIISIDDVNYYDYMEDDGFADRLVVDKNGKVATEVKTPEGKKIITYDGDVMPILDSFVEEHPDFSYRGAKGIVAVTGYEGALGYNFEDAPENEKDKLRNEAKKVAGALKDSGWLIACHSYTHNSYFKDGTVSNKNLHYDTGKFADRIREYVLEPDIYISPFGYHLNEGDERLQYLKDMGYNYFCPVSPGMRTIYTEEGVVISERLNLDRYNMRNKKEFLNETFFDVDSVYYNG